METSIKTLVIDDELPARKLLSDYISKVPQLELVASCGSALEANTIILKQQIDLIFTDIQMPELSGLEFVKSLKNKPMVVFTTAYSEYAMDSYELEAIYYLLKPISLPNFLKAANKAIELFNKKNSQEADAQQAQQQQPDPETDDLKNYLMVKADYKLYKINFKDIVFIEGQCEYVTFHLTDKRITAYYALKRLEEELDKNMFARIHKSYIVSLRAINTIEGNTVVIGKERLPIGKSYKEAFLNMLDNHS